MAEQTSSLGKFLGTIGFFTGLVIGWNATQNGWAALICAVIVAALGASVGNALQKLLVIAVSIVLAVGSAYIRGQIFRSVVGGGQQTTTVSPSALSDPRPPVTLRAATPKYARVKLPGAILRTKPSRRPGPDNNVLSELNVGVRLDLVSAEHNGRGWYNVRHPNSGERCWIYGDDIDLE